MIGITGNAGSGKSAVARVFEKHGGAHVISADRIGWQVLKRPWIKKELIKVFGRTILNDKRMIDRKILGRYVFTDPGYRYFLNGLIHPVLVGKIISKISQAKKKMVVLDAALLFDWPIKEYFDRTILVTASKKRKVANLVKRGIAKRLARMILASQQKDCVAKAKADIVINNNGTLAQLKMKSREIISEIKNGYNLR